MLFLLLYFVWHCGKKSTGLNRVNGFQDTVINDKGVFGMHSVFLCPNLVQTNMPFEFKMILKQTLYDLTSVTF